MAVNDVIDDLDAIVAIGEDLVRCSLRGTVVVVQSLRKLRSGGRGSRCISPCLSRPCSIVTFLSFYVHLESHHKSTGRLLSVPQETNCPSSTWAGALCCPSSGCLTLEYPVQNTAICAAHGLHSWEMVALGTVVDDSILRAVSSIRYVPPIYSAIERSWQRYERGEQMDVIQGVHEKSIVRMFRRLSGPWRCEPPSVEGLDA